MLVSQLLNISNIKHYLNHKEPSSEGSFLLYKSGLCAGLRRMRGRASGHLPLRIRVHAPQGQ